MKLEKFKEKDHKKRFIVIFTVCCILLLAGVLLYNSFAVLQKKNSLMWLMEHIKIQEIFILLIM